MTKTTTTKKDRNGIRTGGDGYVLGVRCAKGHSGNRRLTLSDGQWYECCGCGDFVGVETVRGYQSSAAAGQERGENMAGGLYTQVGDFLGANG